MPKKRNDGRYELKVRVSRDGEPRKYKAVYGSTLREAQEKKRKLEAEVQSGIDTTYNPSVDGLIDYYLSLRSKEVRPQTVRSYRYALNHISELIGDRQAKSITVDDARKVIDFIADQVSPYQGIRARKMACMVWDDAVTRSVLPLNPWRAVPMPKHKTAEKRPLTEEELQALEQAPLTPYDRALVSILRYTGLRVGEATALQVKDIANGYISVSKTNVDGVIYPPKTAAGKRSVPVPKKLADVLSRYLPMVNDFLFTSNGVTPWTKATIWRHFEEIKRVAHMPDDFSPHIFRHTYTHDLVKNGIPPLTAQVLLGHSSYAITLGVYAHYGWKDIETENVLKIFD
jgi:integrase